MKKVLWIACLLFVMPFLGYSQNHAGLAMQDDETIFGPVPVSKELPSHIQLNNIERHRDNQVWAHAMFVPVGNHHYGVYYEIFEDGTINWVQRYNAYYYSSAEYYKPYPAGELDETFPVWAYADDLLQGFNRLTYVEGDENGTVTPVALSMNELTYDYYHNAPGMEGRMLGMMFGDIYLINMNWNTPGAGVVTKLYDHTEHEGIGRPITLACDLDGTLYFVSVSEDGETSSKLYKFEPEDADLEDPQEVGEVGWAAQHIQTMAFNHKTRELIWWQCDKDNNTNLVKIDKETGATELIANTENTEMAGLIFEFLYKPYTVYCMEAEEGTIRLKSGNAYTLTQNDYKPAKEVEFKVTSNSCYSIETVYVYEHGTTTNPIYTFAADELNNGVGTFSMPACDVDIVGEWVGNEHNVDLTWTPASLVDALVMDGTTAQCGDVVTVTYDHPQGYFLTNITVKQGNTNITVIVNKENSTISFTMPDGDVVVNATYTQIVLQQVPDICQYQPLAVIPNGGHTLNNPHDHIFTFTDPNGVEHTYGPTGLYGNAANQAINAILAALTFDIPGTWTYSTEFISQKYGNFPTVTKSFQVYPAPRSIAIQEEIVIDEDAEPVLKYNAHYNCDGDSIYLKVVADPETYVFNGTFVWTKNGVEVYTSTEPEYLIKPCGVADAGNYNVTYTPNTGADTQEPVESPCDFSLDQDFKVNVASLPNVPEITPMNNEICYHSSVTLSWNWGVLNPREYAKQWFTIDEEGNWNPIEGENGATYTTDVLDEMAVFGFEIRYGFNTEDGQDDYYLCWRRSEPDTVYVKPEIMLEIEGALETCKGINPEDELHVEGDYTNFTWSFNGTPLNETSNTLHFDNYDLVSEVGTFWVEVSAEDPEGCTIYGEIEFTVMELPEVAISNNINDEIAYYNDDPTKTIEVCYGTLIIFTGEGADTYLWGEGAGSPYEGPYYQLTARTNTTVTAQGYNDETGCWNSASVDVIVLPRPVVEWVHPTLDETEFSMITDEFQLEATIEGGIYSYHVEGEEENVTHPIDNGLLKPSELGIGNFTLFYSYTDENGCTSEVIERPITIVKPYWTDPDKWNPNWMEQCLVHEGRYNVRTNADLGSFMAYVYGLNGVEQKDFENDTIWILNDIDLQEKPYFYRPFCDTAIFKGVIDGCGHVVSNMTILENNLTMYVDGFIRNVGVKDAKITSVGNECVVDVNENARFHNSYITMPELNNVIPQLNPFENMLPTGEVRNVYYYGYVGNFPLPVAIYLDNGVTPVKLLANVPSTDLLHEIRSAQFEYEGILEEWVWLQNDFYYRTWTTDAASPANYENYGYPMLDEPFIHHHYIHPAGCDEATYTLGGDVKYRTINNVEYIYLYNEETLTITFEPNTYVNIPKVDYTLENYNGETTITGVLEGPATVFNLEMPLDTIMLPAYEVYFQAECARDYWTDEGNYNANWYNYCLTDLGRWEINSNEDLAALAWEVNYNGHNFEGDTIWFNGTETVGSILMDMTGHFWDPIIGFRGVLDGAGYIVDNLYIRGGKMSHPDDNAMFVDLDGVVRNLGVQDADVPAEGNIATFAFNTSENYNGSVINSYATWDRTLGLELPIANEGVTVTNTYTLDSNGNMYYPEAPDAPCDLGTLNAWVIAQNYEYYFDWKEDELVINYNYPIHKGQYDGGWGITYIPSITDHNNDPEGVPGYVDGPSTGFKDEEITIDLHPNYCYNCTKLIIDGEEITSFSGNGNQYTFTMPDHPITVEAEFKPIIWTLTINYVVDADPSQNPAPYVGSHIYGEEISVNSPELDDYEPVEGSEVVELTMPCSHKTVTVHYIGKEHNITFCDYIQTYATEYGTDHENDIARFNEDVTFDIVAMAGYSIPNSMVSITTTDGRDIDFTGDNGHYTFTMPNDDVTICALFDEEFWDDYGIADIESWFVGHEDDDTYVLTTDSMLGGLAALASRRPWLVEQGYYTEEEILNFDFAGKTILVESSQEEGMIDLIEHKWRPIGAQIDYEWYFQGYFDGQNTEIVNMRTADFTIFDPAEDEDMYIYYSTQNGACQAFFGNIGDEAVVTNLHIQGTATGRYYTAGIAGVNMGLIMNSVANVRVRSEFQAGGIVGDNKGDLINCYCIVDTIESMSAMPLRAGDDDNNYYIGGVAAHNLGRIDNCHSIADLWRSGVMGNNPINYFGGIVGWNEQIVNNCYWKNEAEQGCGGGNPINNCALIDNSTAAAMNARAQELAGEYGVELNGWCQGEDNYPVFDLSRMVMNNTESNINVNLYPNPTKGVVNIFSDNIQRVTVFNMFGQMVLDTEVNGNQTTINMTGFAAGVYMVRIATAEGTTTKNVVVE